MGLSIMKKPFIYAISGYKNSGKTTTITRLIPLLVKKGFRVAVIKHDGHDFVGDEPGTDSYKHQEAGAYGTAVFSEGHYMVNKRGSSVTERDLIAMFPEADIILIEGLKDSIYPKYFCDYPRKVPDDAEVSRLAEEIERLMKDEYDQI